MAGIRLRTFNVNLRTCKRCGRVGSRQFSPAPSGGWVCFSLEACQRRMAREMPR